MTQGRLFFDNLSQFGDNVALVAGDRKFSYAELNETAAAIVRNIPSRSLVFCVCKNCMASVSGYVGFLQKRIVPVLLNSTINRDLYNNLKAAYRPQFVWCPSDFADGNTVYEFDGYKLIATGEDTPELFEDLAVMLTTSGSTGSVKFVRQSYKNIEANTASIVEYLDIKPEDRAITTLPMSYTYGLSILQSHLMAGAGIILTEHTVFEREFWNTFREKGAMTFGAVPYTYQMLDKLRFFRMNLGNLKYLTQAGGRLGAELHEKFARGLEEQGRYLVVMYGATEATARMSYVPKERTVEKAGSIGIAIPGGRFELIGVDGGVITEPNTVGELVYYGDNVTLGYAETREDLAKGDERQGRLETGDMAKVDSDGYYYVVGRKKRFLKLYGNRVNLVEIEELFAEGGYETACVGEDDHMRIYTTSKETEELVDYISEKTGINRAAFTALHIDTIPHNDSGKVLYSELK